MLVRYVTSTRFPLGFNEVVPLAVGDYSIIGLIAFMFTEHVHDADLDLFFNSGRILTLVVIAWSIILGVGLYKGISELTPGEQHAWLPCLRE